MAIRGGYAPPGVYTETIFESPTPQNNPTGRIPLLIGAGSETFAISGVTMVRGSSSTIDQPIVEEDASGRVVKGKLPNGAFILGDYDGVNRQVRTRQWPLVTGDGTGSTAISPSSVTATINGQQIVVLAISGGEGLVTLSQAPKEGDDVRISYFFNRTDTFVSAEDVSSQVSTLSSDLYASSGDMEIDASSNTLILTVDGVPSIITLPLKGDAVSRENHLTSIVSRINSSTAASAQTLSASTYTNNLGSVNLKLSADGSISVGAGTANSALGLIQGQTGSTRTNTFYVSESPIVDGSNAGRTTTEVADVTVLVDGVAVTPSSVDGATGAVTLPNAPRIGQTVKISYYHNTFQDSFDYIPSRDVVSVERVSLVPDGGGASSLFIEDVSWVLREDKLYWGTFASVSEGGVQNGATSFGPNQITTLLKDERVYMAECANVTDTSVIPPRTLPNVFKLPHQPMDGTGTATPTNRTDLVVVRTGVSISDALERNPVNVTRVNPADSTITLSSPVPFGHKVFATFYYNNLQDEFAIAGGGYTISVQSIGNSGQGTYSVENSGLPMKGVSFTGKGTDLSLTSIVFPSGSEVVSDASFGAGVAVEENITVTLSNFEPTPAIFTTPHSAPFAMNVTNSNTMLVTIDQSAKVVDFARPAANSQGQNAMLHKSFFTTLVGETLPYTAASDNTSLEGATGDLFLTIDGVDISISGIFNTATEIATALNAASESAPATYTAMSPMGTMDLVGASYDQLSIHYKGDTKETTIDITIPADSYATADELAEAIQAEIVAEVAVLGGADADLLPIVISVSSSSNFLTFTLETLAVGDTYAYVEFVEIGGGVDFAHIAGIDVDAANGTQTKFGILPIASVVSNDIVDGVGTHKVERLVLRSRTLLGDNYFPPVDLGIEVVGGLTTETGLAPQSVMASRRAVVEAPSLLLRAGWADQGATSVSSVVFYDGTDSDFDANNVLNLDVSGTLISVEFTASGAGTTADLFTGAGTVEAQLVAAGLTVLIEGSNLRIVGASSELDYIKVLDGSANSVFGLSAGTLRVPALVQAEAVASALMNNGDYVAIADYVIPSAVDLPTSVSATGFTKEAVAYISEDPTGLKFVNFESLTTGVGSIIDFTGGTSVTTVGTGLGITTSSGAVGEGFYQGFYVTSSNPLGTGSSGTSTLNDGVGQDGVIGQTYVDDVTGFSFTILRREGGQLYPTGANATLTFKVSDTITTNANIPVNVIPGVQIIVSNTVGTLVGDTALVETFNKSGSEPLNGQEYFVDLTRRKATYNTGVFTRLSDVISAYGDISPQNPLSLGAYLAFLNGASSVALKQIPLEEGQSEPSLEQMSSALVEIEGEISAGLSPSVIVPLLPASSVLLSDISLHCDVQSSLRYRSERTAILGCPAGTSPEQASALAQGTQNSRVRLVYPDILSLTVTNTQGISETFIVDGRYMAVAVACATTKSTIDPATPWTSSVVVGFDGLLRTLDAVDANRTANRGVTILQQQGGSLKIRHGLTTDMSSILSKTPTVVQIADEVHLRARNLLNGYIGQKYLPSVVGQIEGRVNMMFKDLVKQQIVDSYTGLSVSPDPQDPTGLLVEVYYKPIFPLLYIQFTFNIRSSI